MRLMHSPTSWTRILIHARSNLIMKLAVLQPNGVPLKRHKTVSWGAFKIVFHVVRISLHRIMLWIFLELQMKRYRLWLKKKPCYLQVHALSGEFVSEMKRGWSNHFGEAFNYKRMFLFFEKQSILQLWLQHVVAIKQFETSTSESTKNNFIFQNGNLKKENLL